MSNLRPRLCVMEKEETGYGFHLHGERGKPGQFIRLVEPDTPASSAGLLAGDRLMFVNGESVEGESHQQVVSRIRATSGALELIVVDPDTGELLKRHNLPCRKEYVTEGIPLPGGDNDSDHGDSHSSGTPRESSPIPSHENGDASSVKSERSDRSERSERSERLSVSSSTKEERDGLRPRLCHLRKGANGYGFNLHSEKTKPGQFIRAVDDDSPAERAGLRPHDKIIQVNGMSVIGMQHSEVVAAIKAGGDEARLLVVDSETDDFFKRCNIVPTEEHLTGSLPEPASKRGSDSEENKSEIDSLGLGLSVAEAKERARMKRSGKKAPPMDWSKRNELFSNL